MTRFRFGPGKRVLSTPATVTGRMAETVAREWSEKLAARAVRMPDEAGTLGHGGYRTLPRGGGQ